MPNYILYPIAPILNTSTACMNRPASQRCIGRVVRLGEQEPRLLQCQCLDQPPLPARLLDKLERVLRYQPLAGEESEEASQRPIFPKDCPRGVAVGPQGV